MAFGSPGGDSQDQWALQFFLNVIDFGMSLQQAVEAPTFWTNHFPSSFYPRTRSPGEIMIEETIGPAVIDELKRRGHLTTVAEAWTIGRLTAAGRDANGLLRAAATPRLMQAYAVGR